jgi:quinol monooxygenase YgiN
MSFAVVASFEVKPEAIEAFEIALRKLTESTRQEAGCEEYKIHRNTEKPGGYFITESYKTYEDYLLHRDSQHIANFRAAAADFFAQPTVILRGEPAW